MVARSFRNQFLNEIDINKISGLGDLNVRLWAWLEQVSATRSYSEELLLMKGYREATIRDHRINLQA